MALNEGDDVIEKLAQIAKYDIFINRYQLALKRFPQGESNLDVWVLMNDGEDHTIELMDMGKDRTQSNILLNIPHNGFNLDAMSFFVAAQEYSKEAQNYIEILESIITGMAEPAVKELVVKRIVEKL